MRWAGSTVTVIASGPSLTRADADYARARVDRVIAVNESWRMCPTADVLYAADRAWWLTRQPKRDEFTGECWTQQRHWEGMNPYAAGLHVITSELGVGAAPPGAEYVYTGHNSGFQALSLAVVWGARRVVLLGFDMKTAARIHWHDDYSEPQLRNARDPEIYNAFRNAFIKCAPHFAAYGVEIVNASPGSALKCFPCVSIQEALP